MTSERDRMLGGLPYDAGDAELVAARRRARVLLESFNGTAAGDDEARAAVLAKLVGRLGARVRIEPPFRCDYGGQITIGDDAYFNFDGVILDCAPVRIGARVLVGPRVQIVTATHPVGAAKRSEGRELAFPVTIEDDAWLGAGVIVGPGVVVGARSTIGAGSVVVADVPADVVAAGNPCRILRSLATGR
jgi:maltose O-acetyltransferase